MATQSMTWFGWVHPPRVAPNAHWNAIHSQMANKWQKFAIYAEACVKPLDEQSHPNDERSDPKKVSRHRALRGTTHQ